MRFSVVWFALGLLFSLSAAAETAVTTRETELKREPFTDAATIATLPSKTAVEVLKRQGGWSQIKSPAADQGWVRMLNLRFGDGSAKSGGSGLGALFNVARTGSSGTTVTTGVKGLDITKDTIQSASPNPAELKRMHGYSVSKAEALKFASNAHLQKQTVEYLGASASKSSASPTSSPWGDN
ncbi:MAG: SH3 domain-containing protein [Sulfuricella sp.]